MTWPNSSDPDLFEHLLNVLERVTETLQCSLQDRKDLPPQINTGGFGGFVSDQAGCFNVVTYGCKSKHETTGAAAARPACPVKTLG